MKDENGNIVSLREYIEAVILEKDRALQAAFAAQQNALNLATRNLELRLEKLNELREEVTRDRGIFITREAFDARMGQMGVAVNAVERRQSWMMGMGSLLTVVIGLVVAIVGFFLKGK